LADGGRDNDEGALDTLHRDIEPRRYAGCLCIRNETQRGFEFFVGLAKLVAEHLSFRLGKISVDNSLARPVDCTLLIDDNAIVRLKVRDTRGHKAVNRHDRVSHEQQRASQSNRAHDARSPPWQAEQYAAGDDKSRAGGVIQHV
jgi:hypothetical protein